MTYAIFLNGDFLCDLYVDQDVKNDLRDKVSYIRRTLKNNFKKPFTLNAVLQ